MTAPASARYSRWRLTPAFLSYTVSKAGLWALTRHLALALAPCPYLLDLLATSLSLLGLLFFRSLVGLGLGSSDLPVHGA